MLTVDLKSLLSCRDTLIVNAPFPDFLAAFLPRCFFSFRLSQREVVQEQVELDYPRLASCLWWWMQLLMVSMIVCIGVIHKKCMTTSTMWRQCASEM